MTIWDPDAEPAWPLAVIDLEATCFPMPGSWPIEVAVAYVESGARREWLIRPPEKAFWDPAAIAVTGLTPSFVALHGLPPSQVAADLAEAVAGHTCLSDAPGSE